ncbi:MAG: apolipoprotein N-acyltransferase, partial [Roseicyclus sp.]|nr:apolipoprotein N-acyltransferase [Roseicyclus sp.]
IDARGRVLDSLPLGVAGALDVALPPALPPTLYARTGDWPVFLVILAALFAVTARRRVNRH